MFEHESSLNDFSGGVSGVKLNGKLYLKWRGKMLILV